MKRVLSSRGRDSGLSLPSFSLLSLKIKKKKKKMEENSPNRVYILLLVLSSHRSPGEIYSNPTRKRDFLRGVSL